MSNDYLLIRGGRVYDPTNLIDGEVRDLWIRQGKIVEPPTDAHAHAVVTVDATGLVIMPGGIDMHCHLVGPKVNAARQLLTEERRRSQPYLRTKVTRSGTTGLVPSGYTTAYQYLGMGYTTAMDAAITPLAARQAHLELDDTPCIDKGFYLLLGDHHFVLERIAQGDQAGLREFLAWQMGAAKAFGVKLVNPGGTELWKQGAGEIQDLDTVLPTFHVTPRAILREMAASVDALGLPHPVHIHAHHLGLPGNWRTTLDTMRALEGRRGHITHVQFHSYGGGQGEESSFCSAAQPLIDYVNQHPNLTVDVGQVLFGDAVCMTADGALSYYLSRLYGKTWSCVHTEVESSCGVTPIRYRNKSLIHAWQWAIGLEWYLLVQDPWRVAMSTDHPNGGSFLAYPHIIRLLMDRNYREHVLQSVHPVIRERSVLRELDREYSLTEIAIITRAGPAKILGLSHKGHLGPGADADITIYAPHDNRELMFQLPKYVIKEGRLLVEDFEIREAPWGKSLFVRPQYDRSAEKMIEEWFNERYSIRFRNYGLSDEAVYDSQEIPCGG